MSDDESRLERWSRRKRAAALRARGQPENAGSAAAEAPPPAPDEGQPPFDPADLPAIGSIDGGSDIRAFLAPGVPAELTRAALRRAWSTDTAIRDFIGLSENSWDFNAPDGVPGFGALAEEDIRRLIEHILGEPGPADRPQQAAQGAPLEQPLPPVLASDPAPPPVAQGQERSVVDSHDHSPRRSEASIATQHDSRKEDCSPPLPRRGHGGALPK